jgi:F0F1-type ATP synthase assembly protein I
VADDSENAPVGEDPQMASLEGRIAAARKVEEHRVAQEHGPTVDARGAGIQIASTMVGYPLGGIIVGLGFDYLLGTLPWITIGLMFLAFAGACLQIVRMNNNRAD